MKKLIFTALVLCTQQMHAMQMDTAKTQSSKKLSNTCGNAVKACCYLTAACGLMMSTQPVSGQFTQNATMHQLEQETHHAEQGQRLEWRMVLSGPWQKNDCRTLLEQEDDDYITWREIVETKIIIEPQYKLHLMSDLIVRDDQRVVCRQWQAKLKEKQD